MTHEEARIWLRKFDQWFKWNANILQKKGLVAQRVLLENFLDNRMLSKVQLDGNINESTPIQGPDGLLKRLESYYTDILPIIICHHNFISCKQERGKKFMPWWERKLQKGQECSHTDMTHNDWLQLELLRNVYDSELQRKLLKVHEPNLEELLKIATLWQQADSAQVAMGKEASEDVQRVPTEQNTQDTRPPQEEEDRCSVDISVCRLSDYKKEGKLKWNNQQNNTHPTG